MAPAFRNAAHHITSYFDHRAEDARAILDEYGVDLNDEVNGVFLSIEKGFGGAYHPSLHTNAYYDEITKMLEEATSKEGVEEILREIAQMLENGGL